MNAQVNALLRRPSLPLQLPTPASSNEPTPRSRTPARATLISIDWALLFVDFVQIVGLLASMAIQSASFPISLTQQLQFTQAILLDVYGVASVPYYQDNSLAISSAQPDLNLLAYVVAFCAVPAALVFARGLFLACTAKFKADRFAIRHATATGVAVLLGYCLLLPVGVPLARLFHCVNTVTNIDGNVMELENSVPCQSVTQFIYAAVGGAVFGVFALAILLSLRRNVSRGAIAHTKKRHEHFLQLQEELFDREASDNWLLKRLYFMASFQRRGIHYRAYLTVAKVCLVVAFASFHHDPLLQASLTSGILGLTALLTTLLLPFRGLALNFAYIAAQICLTGLSILLLLERTHSLQALLQAPYINHEVWICVGSGLGITGLGIAVSLMQLVSPFTLWSKLPPMPTDGSAAHAHARALLTEAYRVMERCWRAPSLLAPVHELNRQIQLVNRELRLPPLSGLLAQRQQEQDRQDLAHLLEELTGCYAHFYAESIFSTTAKLTVWRSEVMLRPLAADFARRLHARHKSYLLAPKPWRQAILKAYCVAVFVNALDERRLATLELAPALPIEDEAGGGGAALERGETEC